MIRKGIWVAVIIAIVGVVIISAVKFPLTNPWVIQSKVRLLGPKTVYWPLAYYDESWEVVLKGVKSGSPVWLRPASDLYPALDTHPGEEMVEAVSTVFETNPSGAINILVPVYGADVVCGQREEGETIAPVTAEERSRVLKDIESAVADKKALEACRQILKGGLQPSAKDAKR
jgi:hypothetical protein